MRRTILLAGVLPFVCAFLGGVLAVSLMAPSSATAQSGQLQEVRASAFTLVGPDGTVIARLRPGSRTGAGLLELYDAAGTQSLTMAVGAVTAYEQDGTTPAFRAGRTFGTTATGPPLNGVELSPGGSISMLPSP